MTHTKGEISLYVDTMIVEALLCDTNLSKKAQAEGRTSQLIDVVKNYVGNHIDPNDRSGSVLNMFAPGLVSMTFKAMGLGWLGALFGLSMTFFHIDVAGILESIWDKLKSSLSNDKTMTSAKVDSIVNSAVSEHTTPGTEEEAAHAEQLSKTQSMILRDAQMIKLAMIEFDKLNSGIIKESGWLDIFSAGKKDKISVLARVLGWIFKVAIASAGLMIVGDIANKLLDRPNALDGTMQKGKPIEQAPAASPMPVSTQTKFKVQPSFHNETKNVGTNWVENISNDTSSIESMLINFAKEVYQGLDQLDSAIRSTPGFQVIRDRIVFYNRASAGDSMVFLPKYFTSKKQLVDYFIDDVAQKAP